MLRTCIAAALALVLGSCASSTTAASSSAEARDCFRAVDVDGYGVIDDEHVRVTVSPTRHYILTLQPGSGGLRFTTAMALVSRTNFICTGNGWDLELHAGNPTISHRVVTVERAPPDADENPPQPQEPSTGS